MGGEERKKRRGVGGEEERKEGRKRGGKKREKEGGRRGVERRGERQVGRQERKGGRGKKGEAIRCDWNDRKRSVWTPCVSTAYIPGGAEAEAEAEAEAVCVVCVGRREDLQSRRTGTGVTAPNLIKTSSTSSVCRVKKQQGERAQGGRRGERVQGERRGERMQGGRRGERLQGGRREGRKEGRREVEGERKGVSEMESGSGVEKS
jgi:hypothetical protein